MSLRLAVFASGGGTNLQSLLDRFHAQADAPVRIVLVLSDREHAFALERARKAGVDAVVVEAAGHPVNVAEQKMLAALNGANVDLIALAGYLRLIPPGVVRHYRQRVINIHPALLPAFGGRGMFGLRVHRAVIESGATVSGATVHLVNENYDEGPIIAQWPVPVLPADTAQTLADRVLRVEHLLFPAAVEALARSFREGGPHTRFGPPATDAVFQYTTDQTPDVAAIRHALGLD